MMQAQGQLQGECALAISKPVGFSGEKLGSVMGQVVDINELAAIVSERGKAGRSLTALAGAPGSGKSTLAAKLAERLNTDEPGSAAVFAMDGFHFDDAVLEARGDRPRKGAPHTFDVDGFVHMTGRLAAGGADVAVPVFDRELEIARAGGHVIGADVRHILVEGNYLLLDEAPWAGARRYFRTTAFLEVSLAVLTARLEKRWAWMPPSDKRAKLEENDLPNARTVISRSLPAEFTIRSASASEVARLT